jgi:ribosomal protein L14E/L6E/L27E
VIIIAGEFKGRQAIVVSDEGAGIIAVSGFGVPRIKIDRDMVIPINKIASTRHVDTANKGNLTMLPL